MSRNKAKKLYEYKYNLKDAWNDILESSTGEVVADDMRDAVDIAIQFVQLKYFKKYEYPMYVDILEIKVAEER